MRFRWLWVPAFAGTTSGGGMLLTAETIIQSLASGLLMGLLYGLIAVGLALIFGLMDVVNFAHGEFLMIAMYATFFLFAFFAVDPLLSAPLVAAALFVFGAAVYLLIVRFAMRAKANAGMVQIFSTFGAAIVRCVTRGCGFHRALFLHQPHRFRPRPRGHPRRCRRRGARRHRQEQGF